MENQPKIDFKPPFILIQEPIDDFTYVNKKNTVKEDHKRKTIEEKRISVDGMFLSKRIMNNSSSNDPPNFNSKPIEKHSLKEKMLKVNEKEEMNNSLILGNDNPFSKSLVRLKKKSFMSISNYNLDNSEQNLFEEIDIRQEMDILKTYKFYFPNNNCEIILEKMERKKLEDTQKLLCLSPRKRKFKRVSKNNTDMFHHNKRFKKIHPFEIKDKKFLANLIKNNNH